MNSGIGFKDCFARVPLACLGSMAQSNRQQGWYTSGTLKEVNKTYYTVHSSLSSSNIPKQINPVE